MINKRILDKYRYWADIPAYRDWQPVWYWVEGVEPKNGLNWANDATTLGFVIRVGARGFRVRWSRRAKHLFVGFTRYDRYSETELETIVNTKVAEHARKGRL